ncbi:hypothetical protein EON64_14995 [archaeon]|nr:MAG: hypothetical protein EON64_14995 [archaeon]
MGKLSSASSTNPDRKAEKGNMRSKSTIMRLNMYKDKPIRDRNGKVVGGYMMGKDTAGGQKIVPGQQGRIAPDRRWFGNTRVISQTELDDFREKVTKTKNDPYSILLRRKKIPMALLKDAADNMHQGNVKVSEEFATVFGKKMRRKRPNMLQSLSSMEDLVKHVQSVQSKGEGMTEGLRDEEAESKQVKDDMFAKGQSKRIWGELYKVHHTPYTIHHTSYTFSVFNHCPTHFDCV